MPAIPTSARRKRHRTFADRQDLDEASTEPAGSPLAVARSSGFAIRDDRLPFDISLVDVPGDPDGQ